MKKIIQITLLHACLFQLIACGGGSASSQVSGSSSSSNSSSSSSSASSSGSHTVVEATTLPVIEVFTNNQTIVDEPKINGSMRVTNYVIGQVPIVEYDGNIGIEYRGSSSQTYFDKKNYGVETRDAAFNDRDISLLGFSEEEDWVFHGPYSDKTLLRNTLMMDIGASFDRYVSDWLYFELYLDGSYEGVYVLMEKIKRDNGRVDIANLRPEDNAGEELTGGYIIKLDKTNGEHEGNPGAYALYTPNMSFQSIHGNGIESSDSKHHFIFHEPHHSEITSEQRNYIETYVYDFEDALAGEEFADANVGYRNYIDVDSFVDYLLATEISGNVDGYRLSTFLQKDKNGKLAMGPLWDYNLAFGNANYNDGERTDLWLFEAETRADGGVFPIPFWWMRLMEDPYFVGLVKSRWTSLRAGTLSDSDVTNMIESKVALLEETGALSRNFQRWNILNTYVWPNPFIGETYEDEIEYLSEWLFERLEWMDTQIDAL